MNGPLPWFTVVYRCLIDFWTLFSGFFQHYPPLSLVPQLHNAMWWLHFGNFFLSFPIITYVAKNIFDWFFFASTQTFHYWLYVEGLSTILWVLSLNGKGIVHVIAENKKELWWSRWISDLLQSRVLLYRIDSVKIEISFQKSKSRFKSRDLASKINILF